MALRSGYKGFKKLLPGLKILRPGTLGIDNDVLIPELNKTFFPRSEQAVLGAKNFLRNIAVTKTDNGVTYTVNSDKTIETSNTATAFSTLFLTEGTNGWGKNNLPSTEDLLLSGCPIGGANNTFRLTVQFNDSTVDTGAVSYRDTGNGIILPKSILSKPYFRAHINFADGLSANGKTFKPMIRLASDPDDTYVPYAMTNKELTEKANEFENFNLSKTVFSSGTYSDLNNVKTSGIYTVYASALNKPSGITNMSNAVLIVNANPAAATVTQTLINPNDGKMYTRIFANNTWGSWYKFEGTEMT